MGCMSDINGGGGSFFMLGTNSNSHVLSPVQELVRVWNNMQTTFHHPRPPNTSHNKYNRDHSPRTPPLILSHHSIVPLPICLSCRPLRHPSRSHPTATSRPFPFAYHTTHHKAYRAAALHKVIAPPIRLSRRQSFAYCATHHKALPPLHCAAARLPISHYHNDDANRDGD